MITRSRAFRSALAPLDWIDWRAYSSIVLSGHIALGLGLISYELPRVLNPTMVAAGALLAIDPLTAFEAAARPGHGNTSTASIRCPQTIDNGCSGSPGGNFRVTNFHTGYTGTSYPSRISKNNCGEDYDCGMPLVSDPAWTGVIDGVTITGACGMDHMADPNQTPDPSSNQPGCGKVPKNCTFSTSSIGSLNFADLTCSGTANDIVIQGLNLKATGGHAATYVHFLTTATGKKLLPFDNMEADAGLYYRNGFLSIDSGSSGNFWLYGSNQYGHWVDTFSDNGTGTGTIDGTSTVLTIASCSTCKFEPGQYISTPGVSPSGIAAISAQLTGTGGASCPDPTCTNGVGTYAVTSVAGSIPRTSQTVTSRFAMGGGMGLNTSGEIHLIYNAITQINGRICTASQRVANGTATSIGPLEQKYNYVEAGPYIAAGVHYEMCEYVLSDGQHSMTWTDFTSLGNIFYAPAALENSSVSANIFLAPGAVANLAGNYTEAYTNVTIDDNTVVCKGGAQSSACLAETDGRGVTITNFHSTGNEIDRGVALYYNLLNGSPAIGGTNQTSFFTASDNGAHTLTVTVFSGGVPIANGMHVLETKGYIISQLTGTGGAACPDVTCTGGVGTYNVSDTVVSGSSGKRSAFDSIVNAPTVSGNYDLTDATHTPVAQSSYLSLSTGANFSLYNGF